ncbi:dnaJ homolog subfamily B member 14 isoform X1 [Drosophila santomea]|uniref:dnaJ homolog subfamily B member 14 isoform X1 n=1 Tax=Drosophila santomea TaxID=129105 RepID=UPI001952E2EB|nr:dnaJ homolog subfamily B member 14 isoform X1 [Drosophila santomea]
MHRRRMHLCVDNVVSDLCLGHYEQALRRINEGLDGLQDHEEIMALLELKNILVRLRLKGEAQRTIGPTRQSDALPHGFTLAMLDVVQKVLQCRNHYEVLRVSHYATYSEVKRAYHKLALRLHPDKNKSPGAEQAFRRISEAADCLTDCQKRIEYNIATAVGDHCHDQDRSEYKDYGGESEIHEEDYADQGTAFRRPYQSANQRMPQRQSLYQTEQLVIGVVAALVFLFVTMHYITAAPAYSFTPTRTHSFRRLSQTRHVAYYMNPTDLSKYTEQQLAKLEAEIEEVYISDLTQRCRQERTLSEDYKTLSSYQHFKLHLLPGDTLFLRARQGNNQKLLQHVGHMPTPACQALLQLGRSSHNPLLLENESVKEV